MPSGKRISQQITETRLTVANIHYIIILCLCKQNASSKHSNSPPFGTAASNEARTKVVAQEGEPEKTETTPSSGEVEMTKIWG